MCGIVGIVGQQDVAPRLIAGLHRLEYRGYDSAGIAVSHGGRINRVRTEGKVGRLAEKLGAAPLPGTIGIGHTRWATHGAPSERNAHPVITERAAVVHNGIIENHRELRTELEQEDEAFATDTDTEVAAVLLDRSLRQGLEPEQAVLSMLHRLEGAFAFGILLSGNEEALIAARRGSPLAIGYGQDEMFIGSDALALGPLTERILYLEDGDWAVLTRSGAEIRDAAGRRVERIVRRTAAQASFGKGGYRHFMQKEIWEQPEVIARSLERMVDRREGRVLRPEAGLDLSAVDGVMTVACGTSHHAGMVGRYWIEALAGVSAQADLASEFRYRSPRLREGCAVIGISQSGETADTLAALRYARGLGRHTVAIVNQTESSMAREVDACLPTRAGAEIGVASTKAFTAQLLVLAHLALWLAASRGAISREEEGRLVEDLLELPARMCAALEADSEIRKVAGELTACRDALYLGRGTAYPLALEGALKLKELSYIHAEGYAAGEMKHGPIALVEKGVPVVVLAPPDKLYEKSASNMQEVAARGARIILISTREGIERAGNSPAFAIPVPSCGGFTAPLIYAIPVQLLAYHTALLKGTDVDQPRNLAKSVTVE
ncbi:MAG: glutamine--fructose-6-phosphate transaminase (isomerizing) [Acetobacteraceae bacterium]|nr:glutamine--fructose-6-phosphate transaminase (isomerizing) [Acetobacteraceae bacterium]